MESRRTRTNASARSVAKASKEALKNEFCYIRLKDLFGRACLATERELTELVSNDASDCALCQKELCCREGQ